MCRTQIKNLLVGGFWIFAHITGKDGTQLEKHPANSHFRRPRWRRMAAVKRFRAKPMYLNSQRLHPNGRWTSDMRLKRLQTAAMVVMVIFYPNKLL